MKRKEKDKIVEWIKEGKKYKECKTLADAEGITTDFHNSFYKWQQEINPSQAVDKALESAAVRREEREDKKKTQQKRAKWTTQKQKTADESGLAKIINKGVFHGTFPFCKSKQLKEEDVQDINVGGAVVANILYFFPDVNLEHPLIVLGTRAILFFIRFKAICSHITEKIEEIKEKITVGGSGGIKESWKQ